MSANANTLLFQINTRQLVRQVGEGLGRPATLADVPDGLIARWAELGYEAVWLMGAWTTGEEGRRISATDPMFTAHHGGVLPDWTEADVIGSPYAVADYRISPDFGGPEAMADLRRRLAAAGLSLILDFVPNHTARDHAWVTEHPEGYVHGSAVLAHEQPHAYAQVDDRAIAFGRDPNFPSWKDTFQLDYRVAATRDRMIETLLSIAGQCDGVRCDMAMLVLSDVFEHTWGPTDSGVDGEFWARAIDAVHDRHPGFRFMAEAYWGLEGQLRLLGFDFTYNKEVYDDLVDRNLPELRHHLSNQETLAGSLQFLENHDEPRAASAVPDPGYRRAATALMVALPGVRLLHDGQSDARRTRHSIHLCRRVDEALDADEQAFFDTLLTAVEASAIGRGRWQVLESWPTWAEDNSHRSIFAILWDADDGGRDLVVVNLASGTSEANLPIRFTGIAGRSWALDDRLSEEHYVRDGTAMSSDGLFVRLRPYQAQVFAMSQVD